jgi:hypothetical protein
LVKKTRVGNNKQREPGTHELVEESIDSQSLTEKIKEKEKLIDLLKKQRQLQELQEQIAAIEEASRRSF